MSDPNFDDVVLLLHCDGANNSTTWTDNSPLGLTVTLVGDAKISTSASKFGGSSTVLDGVDDHFGVTPANAGGAFDFGTGAWTAEAWVMMPTVTTAQRCVFDLSVSTGTTSTTLRLLVTLRRVAATVGQGASNIGISGSGTQIANGVWYHAAWSYDGTTMRGFLNGEMQFEQAIAIASGTGRYCRIGRDLTGGSDWNGYIDEVRVTKGVCRYTAAFTAPTEAFPDSGGSVSSYLEAPGVLGDFSGISYSGCVGRIADASLLGDFLGYAESRYGEILAPSPLGSALLLARHDFTGQLGDTVTRYVLDITTEDGTVRAPISSWQATLQTGAKSYVQCVVPACEPYVDTITAATSISIKRLAELPDGSAIEYEMASAPTPTATLSQGPFRYTATLTAYADAFAEDEDPPETFDRRLAEIRSLTTTPNTLRARCAVDWLLRPGQRAIVSDEQSIVVAFINYYVNENDQFMDVGNRAA